MTVTSGQGGARKAALILVAGALAATAWWWWVPSPPATPGSQAGAAPGPNAPGALATHAAAAQRTSPTQDNAADQDPLLAPGLRDAIEALLHAAGESPDPEALKQRLQALVGQHFAPELATRALALAQRYVDYRVALGALKPPADAQDPRALRSAIEQRRKLRTQHFDDAEYAALFGQEELLDSYTLARMEIERNPDLDTAQKNQALAEAEALLPAPTRAQRAESVAHVGVAEQTAHFNAQGTDSATRYAQRSTAYGAQAADRLAQLDREERDWNTKLDQYQQALQQGADSQRTQQLRGQLFTPEEQLRLEAALALRSTTQTSTR